MNCALGSRKINVYVDYFRYTMINALAIDQIKVKVVIVITDQAKAITITFPDELA